MGVMSTRHPGAPGAAGLRLAPALAVLVLAVVAGLAACTASVPTTRAFCGEDADCSAGARCVVDLEQNTAYCAALCARTADCPRDQRCVVNSLGSNTPTIAVCVDRVRSCGTTELCNGLDDDCDGVIDGPGCTPIARCNDDDACGALRCGASLNQATTLCVGDVAGAKAYGEPCSADGECLNGVCDVGVCAPLCAFSVTNQGQCGAGAVCARGVGPIGRPDYNTCQPTCDEPRDCPLPGTTCVWRDVFQGDGLHAFVCARPGADRNPLGAACPRNNLAGDDTCASGLCFDQWCTRGCSGPGGDCADVGPDAKCCVQQLRYGSFEQQRYVCVRSTTRCDG
jgi:hypothetical protein